MAWKHLKCRRWIQLYFQNINSLNHNFGSRGFRSERTSFEIEKRALSGSESEDLLEGNRFLSSAISASATVERPERNGAGLADCSSASGTKSSSSSDALIISDIIKQAGSFWDHETEKKLRPFRGRLEESLVVETLRNLGHPQLCLRFFLWAGRQIGFSHTARTYEAFIGSANLNRLSSIPQSFLLEIQNEDDLVLSKILNMMIIKFADGGNWSDASEALERLKNLGQKPTPATYRALIQVLLTIEQLDLAEQMSVEMWEAGYSFDSYTMGCFVRCLCKHGRWKDALDVMERVGFSPDTVIYTKMICGLCEALLLDEALSLLRRMRADSCVPNIVTYNTLLTGFLKAGQLNKCKKVIDQMVSEGLRPSMSVFHSLLTAYFKAGQLDDAYKLFRRMRHIGCHPRQVTYNILIGRTCDAYKLSQNDKTLNLVTKVYDEMRKDGFALNNVNVGHLAQTLCEGGLYDKAFEIMVEMMKMGFVPDASSYSKVITFLCRASKIDNAIMLFKQMKKIGITPSVYAYTVLIDFFCKLGLLNQACTWFEEMKSGGCMPNVVTYTSLIHGYLKLGKISEAHEMFGEMVACGCVPNIITYTVLIDGFCKAGDVERAYKIYSRMQGNKGVENVDFYFKEMEGSGVQPNIFTYGALIDGLCKNKRLEDAHKLWNVMMDAGCEPTAIAYNSLIDGLCKCGRFEEAQDIFLKMIEDGQMPDVYTYSSLIGMLFKASKLDLVLKIVSRMIESNCPPNLIIYTDMVDGFCKTGKTEEALKLFNAMQEKGYPPDVITYTAMMDGLCRQGNVDKAIELLQQMGEKNCAPDFLTYKILIDHCCRVGKLSEAQKLLDEMKHCGLPAYAKGHLGIACGAGQAFLTSNEILKEVSSTSNMPPPLVAYLMFVDSLQKLEEAESTLLSLKEIVPLSAPLDTNSLNACDVLVEVLCKSNKVEKAFQVCCEMMCRGHSLSTIALAHLIKGLCTSGKRDEAVQLLDSICQMDNQCASWDNPLICIDLHI